MDAIEKSILSLELSLKLKQLGILFDETAAVRYADNGGFSFRKSMFTFIPTSHIPAPTTDELYEVIPKMIHFDGADYYFMCSVDLSFNVVCWYETPDGESTPLIKGDNTHEAYVNLLTDIIENEFTNKRYINNKEWEK